MISTIEPGSPPDIPDCETPDLRVAKNLLVQFKYSAEQGLEVLWTPRPPTILKGQARRVYREHRDAFMRLLAYGSGKTFALVELDEKGEPDQVMVAQSFTTSPSEPQNAH